MFGATATQDRGLASQLAMARAQLANQERQIQELNHRIANSLQLAADMLIFEQLRARDPLAQAALEATRARLVAVGELHRYLYDHADRAKVELKPFLVGLCQKVAASTGLLCEVQADRGSISGDVAQQLGIAINELAINAAKHAYDGRPGGRLDILARNEGASLALTVADRGKGLPVGGSGSSGLGMSIVAAIIRELGATLTARSEDGARFTIRLPLSAASPPRSFEAWAVD